MYGNMCHTRRGSGRKGGHMELHFNVTGEGRKALVEAVSEELGTKAVYMRMPSCSYRIGEYTVDRDGTLSWPDGTDVMESGGVVDACVMAGFEPEEWDGRTPERGDRLTVTVPADGFTEQALGNLRRLVGSKAPLIRKAVGCDDLTIGMEDGKLSFPWFHAADADSAAAYTHLVEKLCALAGRLKRVTAKENGAVNEKYAFRCFLLRLGFIGDEYRRDRRILLKNLPGSAAFRDGRKGDGHAVSGS